jgi:hypothetical protein
MKTMGQLFKTNSLKLAYTYLDSNPDKNIPKLLKLGGKIR